MQVASTLHTFEAIRALPCVCPPTLLPWASLLQHRLQGTSLFCLLSSQPVTAPSPGRLDDSLKQCSHGLLLTDPAPLPPARRRCWTQSSIPTLSTISLSLTETVPFPLYWPFSWASVQLLILCDRNSGKNGQNCSTCTPWQDLQRSGNGWPLWWSKKVAFASLKWVNGYMEETEIFWSHEKEMSGRKPELYLKWYQMWEKVKESTIRSCPFQKHHAASVCEKRRITWVWGLIPLSGTYC